MGVREDLVAEVLKSADRPLTAATIGRLTHTPVRTVKATLHRLEADGLATRNGVGSWRAAL
jgi:DNA-binding GntR family transcriptional regulator